MSTVNEETDLQSQDLDPDSLDPAVYHAVIGPPLQAAAEVAASRGDPTLHADMPAMLALIDMVSRLRGHWLAQYPADAAALARAPAAACVMVLQQAKLEAAAVGQCLAALETAYVQLVEQAVTAVAAPAIERAADALATGSRETALADLKQASHQIVTAIEAWQARSH